MQTLLDILLPVSIGVIMFGIGMGLTTTDFKRVFIHPKAILYGLFGQMVLVALIGFIIAFIFPLEPIYQLGIILIAICPGGTSSNIVSYMLNGRVALSVSITAFNSMLVVLTIPLLLKLAFELFWTATETVKLSVIETFTEVVLTVLIPVIIGLIVRHYFPSFVERLKNPLRYILPAILFVVFSLVLLDEGESGNLSLSEYSWIFLPAFLLNIFIMLVGFFSSSRIMNIDHQSSYTLAIEMGLQNSALAIYLAEEVVKIDGLSLIAVLYGGFSFFSTLGLAYVMKNYWKKKEKLL